MFRLKELLTRLALEDVKNISFNRIEIPLDDQTISTDTDEARNIYNLSFFYGQFITHLVEHKKVDQVKKSFGYLRFYGVEIAKAFPKVPSVYFDVAVIAFEMKKLLELIHHDKWDKEIQKALLNEILQVDNPPDFNKEDLDQGIQICRAGTTGH